MIARKLLRRAAQRALSLPGLLCAGVIALCLLAPAASANEPWWHMLSIARPSYLHPGRAADDVQDLTVKASKGDFLVGNSASYFEQLLELEALELGGKRTLAQFTAGTVLPFDATPAQVRGALERAYPERSVEVKALAAGAGEHRYEILFPGQSAEPVLAEHGFLIDTYLGGEELELEGASAEVSVQALSQGEPDGYIVVTAANLGDATIDAEKAPVRIADVLPEGLQAVSLSALVPKGNNENPFAGPGNAVPLECSFKELACTLAGSHENNHEVIVPKRLPPFDQLEMRIGVIVEPGAGSCQQHTASCKSNTATISGGGAPGAWTSRPVTVGALGEAPAPFGIEDYEMSNEEEGGAQSTQAGFHPFQTTFTTVLNTSSEGFKAPGNGPAGPTEQEAALAKDLLYNLPPGWIGDPQLFERCSLAQFYIERCPPGSVLGVTSTTVDEPDVLGTGDVIAPLYNLEPEPGEAARFGFFPSEQPVFIDATVRTGGDYGVTVHVENITQITTFLASEVTLWGVPGEASHDGARDIGCLQEAREVTAAEIAEERYHPAPCHPLQEKAPPAFLTLPTSCTGPSQTTLQGDSWLQPLPFGAQPTLASDVQPALEGCNRLPFTPSINVTPDGTAASSPTGLSVDEHVPQSSTLNAKGLAESDVKGLSVTLPQGVQINPSAGDGLLSCSEAQIGLRTPEPAACPPQAKVATVRVKVPVLEHELSGAAYIATQNQNPFGSLVAMYIYAEDPVSGVRIKAAGKVEEDPATGRLTAHFEADPAFAGQGEASEFLPEAPFEDVVLHFFGGERAPLATPARCGAYTTTGTFTPWSAQESDREALTARSSSTFDIESGPHGAPCPGPSLPFSPSLTGGTTNVNAGAFSPLVTTIGRQDGEQSLQHLTLHEPAGLEGILAGVKLCPEPQANEGTCGPESLIGETIVSAGVGSDPVSVTGGRVYLTGGYAGAPFGLSIVNPVRAGPFDLEHDTSNPAQQPPCDCVVVRAKIEVDPRTAELTITTDPSGPHAIPRLIDGIPVQIRAVNVTVNREHFTLNPTSCDPLSLTGSIGGDEGATQPLSVPFQAANCAVLKFTPTVAVSTAAKPSKVGGASLNFRISYPRGALGTQSWFNEAKFDIPRQLPARLTTIQQACLAATFEDDRGACPAHSIIGHAVVHTPVLPVPLEGPVYFVSYGGAAFPDAVLVLDGYGVHIELHGNTFIDGKTGVTSATFKNTPDVPFESIEVSIPSGPFSEFGANLPARAKGSFCGQKLVMPTLLKAQNGLEIKRNTPVTVTGCGKVKTRAQKLKAALQACHRRHGHKRAACEKAARRAYGARASKSARRA